MSARPLARRETRDGRTLRYFDDRFWNAERAHLSDQLRMLQDFVNTRGVPNTAEVPAEECRLLEYRIQCLKASITNAGKNGESAQWLKEQVEAADPGFQNWYDLNQNMRDSMMRQLDPTVSRSIIEGQYKCFDAHCKNFTYGFETEAALRDHISLHGIQLDDYSTSAAVIQKRASNISLEDREMTGIREYDPSNSETERSVLLHSPIQRRDSIKPISDYQMKGMPFSYQVNKFATATKNAGPCLRCKVLKKKCDCNNPCKECPHQDILSSDLWKALGCFHGSLNLLAKRTLQSTETCLFNLPEGVDNSQSITYKNEKKFFWVRELWDLSKHLETADNEAFDNQELRRLAFHQNKQMQDPDIEPYQLCMRSFAHYVAVLKAAPQVEEARYVKCAFNPFGLFRLGDQFSSQSHEPKDWDMYKMAKELLVASMHFREDLTLQQEAQDTTGLQQSSATTVPDIKTPLDNFLNAFDTRFTNRKELSVDEWLGSFYALCVISIVKTILIDTSSPAKHPKSGVYAAQLTTIYKVLVSVFSWSAKVNKWCQKENELRDPLMRNWASNGNLHVGELVSAQLQSALKDTKKLVRQSQWSGAGIKHTKDFLLSLGTGKFADKGFNGFSVQVIQHKSFEKAAHNTPRMVVGTPQLTPLQPKRQQSPEHAGIGEYQPPLSERMNYIRPAPVAEPTPDSDWANRSNPGLRRSNMAEVPRLSYAQRTGLERTPMGPPGRDVFSATRDGELPANWKSAPKSYTGRIPGAPTEAHEDVQYWNSPASSTFTPIRKAYDDNDGSYQRAKFQRRENEYYEAQMRHAEYRTANGNREEAKREEPLAGDEYRRNSFIAPRKEPRLPLPYSGTENERPQAQMGQGSYYAPPGPPINREPSAKRRHSQFSLGNDQPAPEAEQTPSTFSSVQRPIAPVNPRNETSASTTNTNVIGGLAGTAVFGLNNSMLEKSKPKRRELSKEQREQAAVVRRLGACPECKAKKVKCDPSHEGPRRIGACDACKKAKVKCQPSHFSDLDPRLHIPPNSGQTSMSPINGEEPPKKKKKTPERSPSVKEQPLPLSKVEEKEQAETLVVEVPAEVEKAQV